MVKVAKVPRKSQHEVPIAVERGIPTLILDAIVLAIEAQNHSEIETQNTLARASIISSVLFLEACANCCLDMLALNQRFAADVDRLPTISKFDLFLYINFTGKKFLDRSRTECQAYYELKSLRDTFVHPRAQRYEWVEWSEESSVSTSPKTNFLKLPKIPAFICPDDAVIVLKATHKFASYFFKECCCYKPIQVSAMLHSEEEVPNFSEKITPVWGKSLRIVLDVYDIDISYMKISWY